jgi:hypothetical protein
MISNNIDNVKVMSKQPSLSCQQMRDGIPIVDPALGSIQIRISYINTLPTPVVVIDRNGFRHSVKNKTTIHSECFTVRTEYVIEQSSYDECKRLFSGYRGTGNSALKILGNAFYDSLEIRTRYSVKVGVDHKFTLKDFESHEGNIYHIDTGLLLSTFSFESAPAHPVAIGSVSEAEYTNTIGKNRTGFAYGVGIEMINREVGATPMYIYSLKKVSKIPVGLDKNRTEGFYITSLERNVNMVDEQKLIVNYYPLNEAENIGIYKSADEAATAGNVKLLREEELATSKHEVEKFRLEAINIKARADQANLLLQAELNEKTRLADEKALKHKEALDSLQREYSAKEMANNTITSYVKREHENSILQTKMQMETSAQRDKIRDQEHSEKLRALELERLALNARIDKERQELKDKYDDRDQDRKSTLEVLKLLSTALTTIGVVVLTYEKLFKKK